MLDAVLAGDGPAGRPYNTVHITTLMWTICITLHCSEQGHQRTVSLLDVTLRATTKLGTRARGRQSAQLSGRRRSFSNGRYEEL